MVSIPYSIYKDNNNQKFTKHFKFYISSNKSTIFQIHPTKLSISHKLIYIFIPKNNFPYNLLTFLFKNNIFITLRAKYTTNGKSNFILKTKGRDNTKND